jgi:hypothetical protein
MEFGVDERYTSRDQCETTTLSGAKRIAEDDLAMPEKSTGWGRAGPRSSTTPGALVQCDRGDKRA